MNNMSIIRQTKVLRIKMELPITLWRELDEAMDLNPAWGIRILKGESFRPVDIAHDIEGILKEDEYFLPRI